MNGIVAAEAGAWGLRLYFHAGESFRVEEHPFAPFVLLDGNAAVPENCQIETLSGSGNFCRIAFFASFEAYQEQLAVLKKTPGVMVFNSLLQQALSISRINLFGEVSFTALRCLSFAVSAVDEKITEIRLSDNCGNEKVFSGEEADILQNFTGAVNAFDPDILIGFNCCREALPLLVRRAKKCKVKLDCGRDGSGFVTANSRYSAGDKQYSYQRFTLAGRHVVDMLHVVQLYDAVARELDGFELEVLKEHFHIEASEPEKITGKLAEILLPAYFYRTRELPLGFQECILRGSGSALDALLVAEYLQRRYAIPLPEAPRAYAGALSSMENSGVFHRVRHCDVRSLYPSLLLTLAQAPVRDEAGIFLELLAKLRAFRLAAKDLARQLPDGVEKQQQQSLQSSFKILINSFYGYLGFAQGAFNDFALAEKITAKGRELLGKLVETLQNCGATVIEMDTDGIYFQQPEDGCCELDEKLNSVLPPGIQLEFDADYPAMYSYKAKNYALLNRDGSVKLTGAALKSRALEPFKRKFIMQVITARLHDDPEGELSAYNYWQEQINSGKIAVADLAKSEVLSDSPENYRRKLASGSGRRSAAYELALGSGREFRAGDKVKFYVTGSKAKLPIVGNSRLLDDSRDRDENIPYYLNELNNLAKSLGVI